MYIVNNFILLFQKEKKVKFENETLVNAGKNLEKFLKQNKGGDGYFVGDSVSKSVKTCLYLFL